MRGGTGSRYKNLRKRVKPLRPWIIGLNVPSVVSELADVKPFIYLCCKLSITEQSWANMPESPKALIVRNADSLSLCDGQFWIDLNVDNSLRNLLVCRNKFRNRDACFFIVFLDEYMINYDSNSQNFVASVKDLRIVNDTHCLSESFSSIPPIKSAEKDLLTAVSSPTSEEIETGGSSSRFSNENDEDKDSSGTSVSEVDIDHQLVSLTKEGIHFSEPIIIDEGSGSDAKKENNDGPPPSSKQDNFLPPEQSSSVDRWIPTQNPSYETFSFGEDIDNVSVEDESDGTATSDRVLPTPRKTIRNEHDPLVDRDLFHVTDLTSSGSDQRKVSTASHSVELDLSNTCLRIPHTPQKNSLSHINSSLSTPTYSPASSGLQSPPGLQTDFLTWLSTQEATVEICYLEEAARAINDLRKIEPMLPFSDYFNNFAFTE